MDDTALMQRALALARESLRRGDMPIGAVLARGEQVLAEAFWKGSEGALLDHPESVVLREADRGTNFGDRRKSTLYTTLEPCLMCMGTAMSFFLGRIVYAMPARADGASKVAETWRPEAGHPTAAGAYAVPLVEGGVCEADASALVVQWLEAGATGPEAEYARQLVARG